MKIRAKHAKLAIRIKKYEKTNTQFIYENKPFSTQIVILNSRLNAFDIFRL